MTLTIHTHQIDLTSCPKTIPPDKDPMTTIQSPVEKTLDKSPADLLQRTGKSDRRSRSPHVYITVGYCYASMHTYAHEHA